MACPARCHFDAGRAACTRPSSLHPTEDKRCLWKRKRKKRWFEAVSEWFKWSQDHDQDEAGWELDYDQRE
jgi:hypothetical protein